MQAETTSEKFFTKPLLIIFLTVLIDLIGFGMVIPLLTFYGEQFGASPFDIGILMASYSLMQFIFSPVLGSLSDRYGRRPILFLSIIGSGISYLIIGMAGALWMIYVGRIFGGITAGNLSTAQAYIADVTTRENRAKGMGLFGMAFGLGFILGPAIAGILSKFGTHVPFYFAAGLSFLNAGLLYLFLPESRKPEQTPALTKSRNRLAELTEIFRDSRFTSIAWQYFLLVTSFSMMTTAFAFYTSFSFGYNAEQTGYLLAYIGFLAVLMQGGLLGFLVKKFGEVRLIVFGFLMLVLSLFAVPYINAKSGGLIALLIGTAFFSLGNSLTSPSLNSLASKNSSEHEQGKTLGIMQSAASLARVIGPAVCGVLLNNATNQVDNFTLRRNFWTASAIMFIALLVAVYYLIKENNVTA
jgi:DHA1 family tetracycline resistance protein-like MFS transporter